MTIDDHAGELAEEMEEFSRDIENGALKKREAEKKNFERAGPI